MFVLKNAKYHLCHINLEQCFMQQKYNLNRLDLCYHDCVPTSVFINLLDQVKYTALIVWLSWVQHHINWQLIPKNIANIYVIILCIFHLLIGSSTYGSNIQYPMLAFNKEKYCLLHNYFSGILSTTVLVSLVISNIFIYY